MSPSPLHPVPGAEAPAARGARLSELVHEVPGLSLASAAAGGLVVTGVTQDSRKVEPGWVFVARRGGREDGARFIADAIAKGAVAVLVERGSPAAFEGAARLEAEDLRGALARVSAAVHGHPTFSLDVVGITGTNGKTTTAHLVAACLEGSGQRPGIVGTLGCAFGDLSLPSAHTSPEADELARVAALFRDRGATHLVMEVSSIALEARRVEAVRFRAAVFTNLTQDHLDYHGSMEAYGAAKARLFREMQPGGAALNVDDAFGRALAAELPGGAFRDSERTVLRYSTGAEEADVVPVALETGSAGISMRVRTPSGEVRVASPLVGAHNVSNLLAALATSWLLELDLRLAAEALSGPISVPGRLERASDPELDDVVVLVDYAHTPDALERVLASVRAFGRGRVTCVFGCGGDRDPKKRPKMGEAAGRGAERVIVTNDNPRSEDPAAIAEAVLPGLRATGAEFEVELDRREAIRRAILGAEPGEIVLVAGKGHEPYQIVGERVLPFDDRDEARAALAQRRAARAARALKGGA